MTEPWSDEERTVELEDEPLLPEQTRDDTDTGWGRLPDDDRDRYLLQELPPHWA